MTSATAPRPARRAPSDASAPRGLRRIDRHLPAAPGYADGEDAARRPTGPIVAVLIVLAAFSIGHVVFALPLSLILFGPDGPDTATLGGELFTNLVPFAGALLALTLWVWIKERRPLRTLGFLSRPSRVVPGALAGIAMISVMVGLAAVTGQLDVAVRPISGGLIAGVLVALVGFVIQGGTEDILFRGFLFQAGARRWGVAAGVGLQAVLFSAVHAINPGGLAVLPLVNLLLFALFLAGWSLLEGGIWVACAWHAAWNWTQGNVAGVQVSGDAVDTSFLVTVPGRHSSDLITGGAFGLEGGLLTTGVLLLGIAVLALVQRRRSLRAAAAIR